MILRGYCGAKGSKDSDPFHIKPKAHAEEEELPRTNKGNPNYQDTLLRTTLSSANQNRRRGRRHIVRGSPFEDPKGDSEPNGSAIGAW